MRGVTRRSLIRGSAGLVATGALAQPYLAHAAATTATVWWTQGFAQEEDIAFKKEGVVFFESVECLIERAGHRGNLRQFLWT